MKVLDAYSWMEQNKDKYPNGSVVSEIMEAYAKYYHEETSKYDDLMDRWKSEWYNKYRLLDIDFETFCKMMNYPKNEHDKYLRGTNNKPGSL